MTSYERLGALTDPQQRAGEIAAIVNSKPQVDGPLVDALFREMERGGQWFEDNTAYISDAGGGIIGTEGGVETRTVRSVACWALARLGEGVLPWLLPALEQPERRAYALEVLHHTASRAAVPALLGLLERCSADERPLVLEALSRSSASGGTPDQVQADLLDALIEAFVSDQPGSAAATLVSLSAASSAWQRAIDASIAAHAERLPIILERQKLALKRYYSSEGLPSSFAPTLALLANQPGPARWASERLLAFLGGTQEADIPLLYMLLSLLERAPAELLPPALVPGPWHAVSGMAAVLKRNGREALPVLVELALNAERSSFAETRPPEPEHRERFLAAAKQLLATTTKEELKRTLLRIARTLGRDAAPLLPEVLLRMGPGESAETRLEATRVLRAMGEFGRPGAETLLALVNTENMDDTLATQLDALAAIDGPGRALPLVESALDHHSPNRTRGSGSYHVLLLLLARLAPERALERARQILRMRCEPECALSAINALAAIGPLARAAIPDLRAFAHAFTPGPTTQGALRNLHVTARNFAEKLEKNPPDETVAAPAPPANDKG